MLVYTAEATLVNAAASSKSLSPLLDKQASPQTQPSLHGKGKKKAQKLHCPRRKQPWYIRLDGKLPPLMPLDP